MGENQKPPSVGTVFSHPVLILLYTDMIAMKKNMKIIKTIVSLALIMIGFVLIGELSTEYLENFANDLPNTTLYFQYGIDHRDMKNDIMSAAGNHNVSFFVIQHDILGIRKKQITIYLNDQSVAEWLSKNKMIQEREYNSMFIGSIKVSFADYNDIAEGILESNNYYYLIGAPNNIIEFKKSIIDKYAGNHPVFPKKNNAYRIMLSGTWCVVMGLSVLLTLIYIITRKKEAFIKIIYGENRVVLILKECMVDLLFICGGSLLTKFLLRDYTNTEFGEKFFYVAMICFAFVNSCMYIIFSQYKIKEVYNNMGIMVFAKYLLYTLKLLSLVMISLIITLNMVLIREAIVYISQEDFFDSFKDYFYINIGFIPREDINGKITTNIEDDARIKELFYKSNYESFSPVIISSIGEFDKAEIVITNRNGFSYLQSEMRMFKGIEIGDDYYYILPERMRRNDEIIESLDLKLQNYFPDMNNIGNRVRYYGDSAKIVCIDNLLLLNSKTCKNPIIIVDNNICRNFDEKSITPNPFITTYDRDIMYKLNQEEYEDFIDKYGLNTEIHGVSNVYEIYQNGKSMMRRILKMSLSITVILLLLETIVLTTIIKVEFRLNAYELLLKKLFGYALWERYSKLVILSLIGVVFVESILFILALNLKSFSIVYGSILMVIICFLELAMIRNEINRVEKASVPLFLKGGQV